MRHRHGHRARAHAEPARRTAPARELLAQTYPGFEQARADRMALEQVVRQDASALTPQQRQRMLVSPFVLLSPTVEERLAQTQVDWRVAAALASLVVLLPAGQAAWSAFDPDNAELGLLAGGGVALGLAAWQAVTAKRRWVLRAILPRLARSLAPLRPTTAEIDDILGELRRHKHKMGSLLRHADFEPPARRGA